MASISPQGITRKRLRKSREVAQVMVDMGVMCHYLS